MSTPKAWAEWYLNKGWVAIPVEYKTKKPLEKSWATETVEGARSRLDESFPSGVQRNIGLVLGEASGDLVDIDLDCPEAIELAPEFLPKTLVFGRKSARASHWLYISENLPSEAFRDPAVPEGESKSVLVEIRSFNKKKGGLQTVVPPSVHVSGEQISFVDPSVPVAHVDNLELQRAVFLLAAACLLGRHWPQQGTRHHVAMAAAGMLLTGGCTLDETLKVVVGAAYVGGDDELADREAGVRTTAQKLEDGEEALTGAPTLEGLGIPKPVIRRIRAWACPLLRIDQAASTLFDPADGLHPCTDLANARRFAQQHRQNVRYVVEWMNWIVWTGTHWTKSEILARQFANSTAKSIFGEAKAAETAGNKDFAKLLRDWARKSQSAASLASMLKLAQAEEGLSMSALELDKDNWLLACPNGTIDLRTSTLREPRKEDFLTHLCPTPYNPKATAPAWRKTVLDMMGGDQDLTDFVQIAVGYTMTGAVTKECMFLMYGVGANGKSTFLRTLQHVIGEAHACTVPSDVLLMKAGQSAHPTGLTIMHGKRLAVSFEPEMNKALAEGLVKSITGGDKIAARRMREDFFEYKPRHTIWLSTNHKPIIRGTDNGIWRRILPIPFTVTFTNPDEGLSERLKGEAEGILRWVVEGAQAFVQVPGAFTLPEKADAFKRDYQQEQDRLAEFLDDCIERCEAEKTPSAQVWSVYLRWCAEQEEEHMSKQTFWKAMDERGFPAHTSHGVRYRGNCKLKGALAAMAKALKVLPGGKTA